MGVNTCCRHCDTSLGSDTLVSSLPAQTNSDEQQRSEHLSGEVHMTGDPAQSVLRHPRGLCSRTDGVWMHRFDLRNATPPGTAQFSGSFEVQTVEGR